MEKPHIQDAVGLAWRPRKDAWAAVWLARHDYVAKGFRPSTVQLGVFAEPPTEAQAQEIRAACERLQLEMYGEKPPKETGTLRWLIGVYQTDPDSPYATMRHYTKRHGLDSQLRKLSERFGTFRLADIGARECKRIYEETRWPAGKDGPERRGMAHHAITALRMALTFGTAFEIDPACARIRAILGDMKFEKGTSRTEVLTLRQCEDIIAAANGAGLHSMAIAQALARSLGLRQRDCIGEWVPVYEPGVSGIVHHGEKWLRGIRWEEISSDMILTHTMSKSRIGKVLEFDLKAYPLVMAELDKVPAEKRVGPLAVCELTGRPWKQNHFRLKWREIATKAGVPKTVQNRDSRAGSITEVIKATGGNLEAARHHAGHSEIKTTLGYSREALDTNRETAAKVTEFRAKNRG